MFTGIVEEVGRVVEAREEAGNLRVRIEAERVVEDMALGDSVAVSGACLTVVAFDASGFTVELSKESLAKTAPRWQPGQRVNLERAMSAMGRFGGHIVSGHVEGVGAVVGVSDEPGAFVVTIEAPASMGRYLIPKGSITVDGVSLTVVDVGGPAGTQDDWPPSRCSLWLIPHTLHKTTLVELAPGAKVNLESDLLAKYLERQNLMLGLEAPGREAPPQEGKRVA